jgi:hypothetical protein
MTDVLVSLLAIESGGGVQVVERDEIHPVQLELHDEDDDDGKQPRKPVRVRFELALSHPFGYEVEFEGVQTQEHGKKTKKKRDVEQHEGYDGGVF